MRLLRRKGIEQRADSSLGPDTFVHAEHLGPHSAKRSINRRAGAAWPPAWRWFLRPLNLAIVGLAAAVATWGIAYKLSLYQPHPSHSSQTEVAKMWLGPERTLLIAKSRPKPHAQPKRALDSVWSPLFLHLPFPRNGICNPSTSVAADRAFSANCLPRPPPAAVS